MVSGAELILRARSGDAQAYESLVREHQEAAFRLAYLLLGDAGEAEDVTQDAFLRAYKALDRFDTERPFRPWLLRIVANLSRNRRRSVGRYWAAVRRLALAQPEPVDLPPGGDGAGMRVEALWQAVRRLSQADREIIYLRFYLGVPEAEAAAVLDVAPGTVKSRQHRALARLRDVALREYPELQEGFENG